MMRNVFLTLVGAGVGLSACASTPADATPPARAPVGAPAASPAPPAVICPPSTSSWGDPLAHLGRGEGDDFIEILEVVAREPLVYSCTATQGLTIWDATDPKRPSLVVENIGPSGISHDRFPRCQHLDVSRERAQVVITNRGDEIQPTPFLALYDVVEPRSPKVLAQWSGSEHSIEGVAFWGDRIVAAAHDGGLLVVQRRGKSLRVVGSYADEQSNAWQPVIVGDVAYVAEGHTGLRIYRLSGTRPSLLSTLPLQGSSKDVAIDGNVAYVATSRALAIIDVADPARPVLLAEQHTPGTALDVAIGRPGTVLVADWDEIRGYDVRDPRSPREVLAEVLPSGGSFSRVLALDAAASGRVYGGEWQGLQVLEHVPDQIGPEISISPSRVQFGSPPVGEDEDREITIANTGTATLRVTDIRSDEASLEVRGGCHEISAGESATFDIVFTPVGDAPIDTVVRITSDDADERVIALPVTGNPAGLGIGDEAPAFELVDLDGKRWTTEGLRGHVVVLAYFATF